MTAAGDATERTVVPVDVDCAFCILAQPATAGPGDRPLLEATRSAVAFHDAFPSAPGHILVVPRAHLPRLADVPSSTAAQMWAIARRLMATAADPDGWTVAVNDGPAAGQTIAHTHLHLIPRRHGDVPDPRGGVRWVLPDTAPYWALPR